MHHVMRWIKQWRNLIDLVSSWIITHVLTLIEVQFFFFFFFFIFHIFFNVDHYMPPYWKKRDSIYDRFDFIFKVHWNKTGFIIIILFYSLGLLYLNQGKYFNAVEELRAAIHSDALFADAYNSLVSCLCLCVKLNVLTHHLICVIKRVLH